MSESYQPQQMTVDISVLDDIRAWERAHGVKVQLARRQADGSLWLQMLPVAGLDWFINTFFGSVELILVDAEGEFNRAREVYELDEEALQALAEQVIGDHGAALDGSGHYYPLSEESVRLFEGLRARVLGN